MGRLGRHMILTVILGTILASGILVPTKLLAASEHTAADASGSVWVIPVRGTIDWGLAEFVKRQVAEAERARAALILLEISTFGGRVDAATDIRDSLIAARVPTVAFIPERAISAGALIALASERIVMAPGATVGAAEPRPLDEKTLSYVRAEFESTAEIHGRDPQVAAAMVDASVIIEGLTEKGQILTLTTAKARDIQFIDHVVQSRYDALSVLGFAGSNIIETNLSWTDHAVRFLTDPVVAQILLAIGFLALLAEVTTPGWGVPGSIGLFALALFFGSRLIVGLLGFEVILLFALGLLLLAIEAFVIPGFGLAGVLGLGAVGTSLYMSFPDPRTALQAMAITALAVLALILVFLKRFQKSSLWGRLILTQQQANDDYRPADDIPLSLGSEGISRTPLRPAGKIEIEGEYYDAVSDGAMIPSGEKVRVLKVEGARVVVRRIAEE